MGDRTTLVVTSDHGFELGALQEDPSKTRDMRRVSERFHRRSRSTGTCRSLGRAARTEYHGLMLRLRARSGRITLCQRAFGGTLRGT